MELLPRRGLCLTLGATGEFSAAQAAECPALLGWAGPATLRLGQVPDESCETLAAALRTSPALPLLAAPSSDTGV